MKWEQAGGVLVALTIATMGGASQSQATDPVSTQVAEHFVQSISHKAVQALESCDDDDAAFEPAPVKDLISSGFNIDLIGRFVLGRHARKFSPIQMAEYKELYREVFLNSYSHQLCLFSGDEMTVVGSRPIGSRDAMVDVRISREGQARKAAWRVRAKDGEYQIIDLMFEGVSVALSQREEFDAVTARRGVPGLIEMLRLKLATAKASAPEIDGLVRPRP